MTQGTYDFTVYLTDTNNVEASKDLSILVTSTLEIEPGITPLDSTVVLPNAQVGEQVTEYIQATSTGTLPYAWEKIGGNYPPGLGLSGSTAEIVALTGTISSGALGSYAFILKVTDYADNTAERTFKMSVTDLSIDTVAVSDGLVGSGYSFDLEVSGGAGGNVWALKPGSSLPGTLAVDTGSGTISGLVSIPVSNHKFTVVVTDDLGMTAEKEFSFSFRNIVITTSSPLT
ncbi:hypothetical protein LCGC14_2838340, partial [marine sediment metagenome]